MLKGFEGIVVEVIEPSFIKILTDPKHKTGDPQIKTLRFTGAEEWIGPHIPLVDLYAHRVCVYGWLYDNGDLEVCAISRVGY